MRVIILSAVWINLALAADDITPYKFSDAECQHGLPEYKIPESSVFSVARPQENAPNIIYYFSKPKQVEEYPIAIFCSGSETRESISSVIHVHRYFLGEFFNLGVAVITLEQWGVNGNQVNANEFIKHYTRTQRLTDHREVISHLLKDPPKGWNGKFIFVGVSEGGPLVTALTAEYADITLATINWSGAGDWNWREELWTFLVGMRDEMLNNVPWHIKVRGHLPSWVPYSVNLHLPKTKPEYNQVMDKTLADPTSEEEFMGMTYMYHADALNWPEVNYKKIRSPYLVVTGDQDTLIQSSDEFVKKAKAGGAQVTYVRVTGMGHYVRKRQDILDQSFEWLRNVINLSSSKAQEKAQS